MAIRDLSVGQMIQVSNSWLENKKNKAILAKLDQGGAVAAGPGQGGREPEGAERCAQWATSRRVGKVMAAQEAEDAVARPPGAG
jgi:hypothetical protein